MPPIHPVLRLFTWPVLLEVKTPGKSWFLLDDLVCTHIRASRTVPLHSRIGPAYTSTRTEGLKDEDANNREVYHFSMHNCIAHVYFVSARKNSKRVTEPNGIYIPNILLIHDRKMDIPTNIETPKYYPTN